MYVRLAFAVAAHLESEILIVDEVLAVGDAEFQKKCLGKMGDVSKGEGRTVLFVSHNMAAIEVLCNKSIYLKDGMVVNYDKTDAIINQYLLTENQNLKTSVKTQLNSELSVDIELNSDQIFIGGDLEFDFKLQSNTTAEITGLAILIYNERDTRVSIIDLRKKLNEINNQLNTLEIKGTVFNINLLPGLYKVKLYINSSVYDSNTNDLVQFMVRENNDMNIVPYPTNVNGFVKFEHDIKVLISSTI
jgi:lipopolysaccharide transport system ATP-binding protein